MTRQRHEVKPALDEMTFEESMALIKSIREDRRISKFERKERKAAAPKTKKARKSALEKLMDLMTPEERAAIIAQLEG